MARLYAKSGKMVKDGTSLLGRYHESEDLEFVNTLERFPEIKEAYDRSFSDYVKWFSATVQDRLISPGIRSTGIRLEDVNEAIGKAIMGFASSGLRRMEGGMGRLSEALRHEHEDKIMLESPVEKIVDLDNGK